MKSSGNTAVARLVCDEGTARRVANLLSESPEAGEAAIAAFEGAGTQWAVEVHFETPPDEAALRRLVATVTGARLTFHTVAPKDWVAASLADLKPVIAGRFTVHGAHDRRARLAVVDVARQQLRHLAVDLVVLGHAAADHDHVRVEDVDDGGEGSRQAVGVP